jgi:integrase
MADNLDDLLTKDVKTIKYSIGDYLIYLRDIKKVSYLYRRNAQSSLHIFFEMNEVELSWIWISRFLGKNETVRKDREYTYEEISKMLDYCTNIKYKALILLLCSSGPRIGAIPGLRIGDLAKIPDCENFKDN